MELSVSNIVLTAKHRQIEELRHLASRAELVGAIGAFVHALQAERGASSLYLASGGSRFEAQRGQMIADSEAAEIHLRECFRVQLDEPGFGSATLCSLMAWVVLGMDALPAMRQRIAAREMTADEAMISFSRLIAGLVSLIFDVADSAAVEAGFKEVAERFGRLDILVNNAGFAQDAPEEERAERDRLRMQQIAEIQAGEIVESFVDVTMHMPDERWRRMLAVHLDGTFYCTREGLKIMAPQRSGSIICMGSIMGTAGGAGAPHYCAAKAGIMGFARSLAREVVERGIRVNSIAPGYIDTPMTAPMTFARPFIEAATPMRRFGEPDDIAWAAVYLASDEAKFVTGQVLSPNGGYHMSQ